MNPAEVTIRDESIKLGQFLKLANLVETGGEAKAAIAAGEVKVNHEIETRRGKTLRDGDLVEVASLAARVKTGVEDDFFDEATADDDFDPEVWRNM